MNQDRNQDRNQDLQDKQDAFGKKLTDILNHGAVNLALGLGYKLELFETMVRLEGPATVDDLAREAGVNQRYVREWLGIMATAGIVELVTAEAGEDLYLLPPEHAAFLARDGAAGNMGVYFQEIPLLTEIALGAVSEDFSKGQGVPFSRYPRFQAFMSELSHAKHRDVLIDKFLPLVDDGNLVIRLKSGIRVCDLGCGQGIALMLMAEAYPDSRFSGIDNDREAIDSARSLAADQGLTNVEFILADAAGIRPELAGRFDYITAFDAVHDQTRPLEALKSVRHMLAPGGMFSMIDIDADSSHRGNMDHPMGPFLYTVSLMHCMPVGLSDGGRGLGMMWGRQQACRLLDEAGFTNVRVLEMAHDPFNVHYFCRIGEEEK